MIHETQMRVAYADTDPMGVVYYANYLVFFEKARTELMRDIGFRYRDLEINPGLILPVVHAQLNYHAPARYDDLLLLRTTVTEVGHVRMRFDYQVLRAEDPRPLVDGYTLHAVINRAWKPIKLTPDLRQALLAIQTTPPWAKKG